MFYRLISSLILFKICCVCAQARTCTTPNQLPGTCITLNDCPELLHLMMTQNKNNTVRTYLRASVCQYSGNNPIVCCPQASGTTNSKLPKSPECGFSNITIPRVVNGVPAKLGEFPWIAALGYQNSKNPNLPRWLCGGSLITNKHVLTAGHCVYNRPDLFVVRLGDLDLFSNDDGASPSTIRISKAKVHENYDSRRFSSDIAILTLAQNVNNPTVWPICLPVNEPYRSMTYLNFAPTLAGWGATNYSGPSSSTLQQIFVPVQSTELCRRSFGNVATIDDRILCAGSLNGDKDACGGDSGGPLMHEVSETMNYRIYQIGIVSYGFRCAEPGFPGVYTRLTAFIDWIENALD